MGTISVVPIRCVKKKVVVQTELEGFYERNYTCRRLRNQTLSIDKGNLKADYAGL